MPTDLPIAAIECDAARAAEIGPGVAFACDVLEQFAKSLEDPWPPQAHIVRQAAAFVRRKEREL